MSREMNRIMRNLDRQLDPKKTEMTIEKWKTIAEGFSSVARMIEKSGYYPTISLQESILIWVKKYLNIEGKPLDDTSK